MRSLNKNWRERRWKKKNKVKLMKSSQIHKNKNRVNQKKNRQKNRRRMLGCSLLKLFLCKMIQSKSKKKLRQNLRPMETQSLTKNYQKRKELKKKNCKKRQKLKTKNNQSKRKIQTRQKMKQNKMTSRFRMKSNLQNLTRILNPIQRIQMRNQTAAE